MHFFSKSMFLVILCIFFIIINESEAFKRETDQRTTNNIQSGAKTRPNFIILFADDLGYGDLTCTGNPSTETPNLQKMVDNGMWLTHWYSGQAVCSPSRAAMLTGRYPIRSGCAGPTNMGGVFGTTAVSGLPPNETTFADIVSQQGYSTKMLGKWHLGIRTPYLPTKRGFDSYLGIPYSVDMGKSPWGGINSVILPLVSSAKGDDNFTVVEQPADLTKLSATYLQAATDFIETEARAKNPFLLYFAFNHVHVPNFISPEFCNKTSRGQFGDALAEMDDVIGAVLNKLESLKIEENTLVFFTSDNGPWLYYRVQGGSAGPFRDGKLSAWEGGFREPGIVYWPGTIPAGTVSREIVSTMDIFATVATLSGGTLPTDRTIDGQNMYPIFTQQSASKHDRYFYYGGTPGACHDKTEDPANCPGLWAVRYGDYKLHYASKTFDGPFVLHDPPLLYNVEQDISESWAISSDSEEYKTQKELIDTIKLEHELGVKYQTNYMALGNKPEYAICCNATATDPEGYDCNCNPENWDQPLCLRDP